MFAQLRLTAGVRALLVIAVIGGVAAAGCSLPPVSPTPVDPGKPPVTMTVRPGTVTLPAFSTNQFLYSACFALSNPRDGVQAHLERMEFTPLGPSGEAYATQATVGGFRVQAGGDVSDCWSFQEFNPTHPTPATYRLRFVYYRDDAPALLSVEGTSSLVFVPSR